MFRDNSYTTRALQPEGCSNEGFPLESSGSYTGLEARGQPTYTTVGSLYNPRTSATLQPPTRRPRTRRYPQPIQSPSVGTFMPFSDALLSALPLKGQSPSPPTTASILRQYSPLRQNCDRAANPADERDHTALTEVDMAVPSIRSGNVLSPTGFECNDSVAAEETLTSRITVKGLTSLASYPNPMQKAAQNTLARARAANLDVSRTGTPSSLSSTATDVSKDRLFNPCGTTPVTTGGPQPLKAGPPGQRPFKPTTIEAATRTLRVDDQTPIAVYLPRSPVGLPYNLDANILSMIDDDDGVGGAAQPLRVSLNERQHGPVSRDPSGLTGLGRPLTPGPFDTATNTPDGARRKVYDTLLPEKINQYYPSGFPPNYDGRCKPKADDWHTKYPTAEDGFAQETFSDRMTKINRNFYASAEGLARNTEQVVRDHAHHCMETKVGVIGGERERLRGSHIERLDGDGKVQSSFLSVEDVDRMDKVDITRPLVNMALATLLRYKEESESVTSTLNAWPSGFIKANPAWVDISEEGNKSFFSKPKEEKDEAKKKRCPRRPRRGY